MHQFIFNGFFIINLVFAIVFGNTALANGSVKVFILAGQSNMQGKAAVYTLDAVINDSNLGHKFRHLKKGNQWVVRDDVYVTFLDNKGKGGFPTHGALTVGFGSEKSIRDKHNKKLPHPGIGPELGIGHVLGDFFEEPVLLIKAAWGGRSVKYSFRPPSAMPSDEIIRKQVNEIEANRKKAILRAEEAKSKGKKFKAPPLPRSFKDHKNGYGADYKKILSETGRVLGEIGKYVPNYSQNDGYEIAGFIWFQGWNDGVGSGNPEYSKQMEHFIDDMRKDLKVPNLPFVIGELGIDGENADGWIAEFRRQQSEIAAIEKFKGNVSLAKTAHCWPSVFDMSAQWEKFRKLAQTNSKKNNDDPSRIDPGEFYLQNWKNKYKFELSYTSDRRYHYLGSGACYYEMGVSMGEAMIKLLSK